VIIDRDTYLAHYGILRKSGRYPWGSGETQSTRNRTFLDVTNEQRKQGMSDADIAKGHGLTTTQLRAARSIAGNQQREEQTHRAEKLKAKGWSNVAIGTELGINESSVRSLLSAGAKDRADNIKTISDMLKRQVDEKGYIDIGAGVENHLGVSSTKLNTAAAILQEKGYEVHKVQVDQLGTKDKTTFKVLAPPGTTYRDVASNTNKIRQIDEFSEDGGRTMTTIHPRVDIDSKRIDVKYKEDGGADADGVIYVRPGVKDVSIGNSHYAQVRVGVDGTHYLKGMAVYKDDLPDGVDLQFNTNKSNTGNKLDAMKKIQDDPENPFKSTTRQIIERDKDGKEHVVSAMNIVGYKEGSGVEGSWDTWSRNLSTQFLSKQSPRLAEKQLDITYEKKKAEFDDIMALNNPAVRKELLEKFSDGVDSSAVHLKAAALPRQATQVILPVTKLKPTEVYAPNFRDGERVVLIRYPHGGTFEIPELTVNNRNRSAQKIVGKQAKDAIGIHPDVAKRLSGADFDGDTVVVIPNNKKEVTTTNALKGLKDFDPMKYKLPDDVPKMSERAKGMQMGLVSNLITDMTIKGAPPDEIARAVKHSMVVIDAEKHHLDYKRSAQEHGIRQLYEKYQGRSQGGGSTLISKATSQTLVPDHAPRSARDGGPIDRATGKKMFDPNPKSFVTKSGQIIIKTRKSTKLAETDDAFSLIKGTPTRIETVYAKHSNRMKDLANQARREMVNTKPIPYSPSAKRVYSSEVASLNAKMNLARRNKPLERQAQVFANDIVTQKKAAKPDMDSAELKKVKAQALATARARTGAQKYLITPTPEEWRAIQEGAISNHQLTQILKNSDIEAIKSLATPRTKPLMSPAKTSRAKDMADQGYTQSEIADALGVSLTTLKTAIK
jgi:DNA-binding NarL/FixJ family response regulator